MLAVAAIAAVGVCAATYTFVQSARASTNTVVVEVETGSISAPARNVKSVSSASNGGVVTFPKKSTKSTPSSSQTDKKNKE